MRTFIISICFLCLGCASINPLDGGAKDEAAPKVLSSYPDSAALNVRTQEIRLNFDEYIKAQNIRDLLIISPSLSETPKTEIKKKSLIISFEDSLRSNTTYTLSLNGSIIDNNEGNILENYQLSFSTGAYLDSLKYRAVVINASDKAACTDCIIALYTSNKDSLPLLEKPVYLGRTSASGKTRIPNLAKGKYRVAAIRDENKNLKLDPDEMISLITDIELTDSMPADSIYVFPYYTGENKATVTRSYPGVVKLAFERPVVAKQLELKADSVPLAFEFNSIRDTLTAYLDTSYQGRIKIQMSLDSSIQDLTYEVKDIPKYIKANLKARAAGSITLSCPMRIAAVRPEQLSLWQDSVELSLDSIRTEGVDVVIFSKSIKDQALRVMLQDSAITSSFQKTNRADTILLAQKVAQETLLTIDLKLAIDGQYILQLLSRDAVLLQQNIESSQKITFDHLAPGSYRIKIIADYNKNGIWDTGNFLLNQKPEDVFMSESVELRSNWDKELTINY